MPQGDRDRSRLIAKCIANIMEYEMQVDHSICKYSMDRSLARQIHFLRAFTCKRSSLTYHASEALAPLPWTWEDPRSSLKVGSDQGPCGAGAIAISRCYALRGRRHKSGPTGPLRHRAFVRSTCHNDMVLLATRTCIRSRRTTHVKGPQWARRWEF